LWVSECDEIRAWRSARKDAIFSSAATHGAESKLLNVLVLLADDWRYDTLAFADDATLSPWAALSQIGTTFPACNTM
jgi:hypothetical protein